jgi:hypothetical protein
MVTPLSALVTASQERIKFASEFKPSKSVAAPFIYKLVGELCGAPRT